MGEWIRVDPEKLDLTSPESAGDVGVEVRVSPYDVPEAVRGRHDDRLNRFIIEFRYINRELVVGEDINDRIAVKVGKHSGRLYAIELDLEKMGAKSVSLHLATEAIESLAEKRHYPKKMSNYHLAEQALRETQDQVLH